jgi:hypothetical protein
MVKHTYYDKSIIFNKIRTNELCPYFYKNSYVNRILLIRTLGFAIILFCDKL